MFASWGALNRAFYEDMSRDDSFEQRARQHGFVPVGIEDFWSYRDTGKIFSRDEVVDILDIPAGGAMPGRERTEYCEEFDKACKEERMRITSSPGVLKYAPYENFDDCVARHFAYFGICWLIKKYGDGIVKAGTPPSLHRIKEELRR